MEEDCEELVQRVALAEDISDAEKCRALSTVTKVLGNSLREPGNARFGTLKKSNSVIRSALLLDGRDTGRVILQILELAGFVERSDTIVLEDPARIIAAKAQVDFLLNLCHSTIASLEEHLGSSTSPRIDPQQQLPRRPSATIESSDGHGASSPIDAGDGAAGITNRDVAARPVSLIDDLILPGTDKHDDDDADDDDDDIDTRGGQRYVSRNDVGEGSEKDKDTPSEGRIKNGVLRPLGTTALPSSSSSGAPKTDPSEGVPRLRRREQPEQKHQIALSQIEELRLQRARQYEAAGGAAAVEQGASAGGGTGSQDGRGFWSNWFGTERAKNADSQRRDLARRFKTLKDLPQQPRRGG